MKRFHYGSISSERRRTRVHCELRGPILGPWLSVEILGFGYYFGWADDGFWADQQAKGHVGPNEPWWKIWHSDWFRRNRED